MSTVTKTSLLGRVALITGGTGHLGSAIATAFAELGATVVLADLDAAACTERARAISTHFETPCLPAPLDLRNPDEVRQLPIRVAEETGRLDIIVNNAALVGTSDLRGWATSFETQSLEAWQAAVEVNLTAPFLLVQAALPWLRASAHASVINVSSIYGLVGPDWRLYEGTSMGLPAAYAATKGGLLQLTRWMATTLAPSVRVNAVTPGGIFRGHDEPFLSRYTSRVPLARMGTEADVVGAAVYLAGDLSAYVTGQNLVVDGGWTAW